MKVSKSELYVLIAIVLGVVMDGLDSSIINVALPAVARSFGTDTGSVAWVTIIYFMMNAGLMLTFGRMGDSGHIRKIYVIGFIIFAAASAMCGLSGDLTTLNAARIVQGVGAAMIGAIAPMMCVKFLPANRLSLGMSLIMLGGSIGFGCGPTVGGFIVDALSWHWVFFINIPIAIVAIAVVMRGLPKDAVTDRSKLDIPGTAFMFMTIVTLVFALEMFTDETYSEYCIPALAASVIFLILFVAAEKRTKHPMLNPKMFRCRDFDFCVLCYMLLNIAYMGMFYILPFYLSVELGLSTSASGLLLLIPSIFTILVCLPAGRYCDVRGKRMMSVVTCALLVLAMLGYTFISPEMGWTAMIPILIASGIMWGTCGASVTSRIVDTSPKEDRAMASTVSNFLYYTGGAIGTAVFAMILTFGSGCGGIPVEEIPEGAFMEGFFLAAAIALIMSVLCLILSYAVKDKVSS